MTLQPPKYTLRDEHKQHCDDNDETPNTEYNIRQYRIVSSHIDFNTKIMVDSIESNTFRIPGFQRKYVWDLKQASRFVESIIVGLPIPQIFLYEKNRNDFFVIDGQQRLLSIYYFVKGRFPKKNCRDWSVFKDTHNRSCISYLPLHDDFYFDDFKLDLSETIQGRSSPLHGCGYDDLDDDDKRAFDMRTIRNVIIRQTHPKGYASIYEIFNRLNSGDVVLAPQEIRHCMYASQFYDMLYRANANATWRRLVGRTAPDIRMNDIEILFRGFAMLVNGKSYRPSMLQFLNDFSNSTMSYDDSKVNALEKLLDSFLDKNKNLPDDAFLTSGRFNPIIFEAVFVASCTGRIGQAEARVIDTDSLHRLKNHGEFKNAAQSKTIGKTNVKTRLDLAINILVNDDDG